jgi:hypothetical protein
MDQTDTSFAAMQALAGQLTPDVLERLRTAHDAAGFSCAAHSEGLSCCVDLLLDAHANPAGAAS